ncbi:MULTISPECIES: DUF998 domain-containing protein [unclassified Arthrobacter]|uniref:DUF998 domain-containing protein n=1 Tax=unclassified Arthrobacter TaxID=235627 RepID=UPI002E01DFB9|nr:MULTISPECIES: DUF998 domain-containing protein [unclassified Arthrobacter]MEC5192062.1 putative membrane protein [Arthrobacter sp. MP_M4]MEC5203650.1 putative membrane protein [Arthrobacter sp. MP_M7]
MTAAADSPSRDAVSFPDVPSTRFYAGALALLSVMQYFVAETAVIGAWTGQQPYSRRTGYISDLGALGCGGYAGRDVCSPAHVLMNASFVVQGVAMMVGALLLSAALLCTAGVPGSTPSATRIQQGAAVAARALTAAAGAGTALVGLVPEDAGSPWHVAGAILYFAAGGLALVLLGGLWLRQTPLGWIILACGLLSLGALITGGITRMDVPEPGTLERVMGYPITLGTAVVGLVVAQRIGRHRAAVRRSRAATAR